MEKFVQIDLTAKQLSLFLAIFDTGSVSQAALQLRLNQSTVSYNLDKLRNVFGDLLFVKSGRGIVPTDKAILLAPSIREIANSLDCLISKPEYKPERDRTPIVIASNVMEMLLPYCRSIFDSLKERAPTAELRFVELGSRHNTRRLLETPAVDLAFTVRPEHLSNSLNAEPMISSRVVCYFDAKVRPPIENIEDFTKATHAALEFGDNSKSNLDLALEELSMNRIVGLRAPNVFALAHLMKGSNLITTMQESLSKSAFSELSYCTPPINLPDVDVDLIWHKRSNNSERGIWLRELVRRVFKN